MIAAAGKIDDYTRQMMKIDREAGAPVEDWMRADRKKEGIPLFLQTQNIKPLTHEERDRIEARRRQVRKNEEAHQLEMKEAYERARAEERERKLAAWQSRSQRAKAIRSREGVQHPGSVWNTKYSRWEHPGVASKTIDLGASQTKAEETDMAKKTKAKSKTPRKSGAFAPLRAGTTRAKIVKDALSSSKTITQLASAADIDRKTLMTHLACLTRDTGIKYEIGEDDRVELTLPAGVTADNVIKEPSKK